MGENFKYIFSDLIWGINKELVKLKGKLYFLNLKFYLCKKFEFQTFHKFTKNKGFQNSSSLDN